MIYTNPIQKIADRAAETLSVRAFAGEDITVAGERGTFVRIGDFAFYNQEMDVQQSMEALCVGVFARHVHAPVAPCLFSPAPSDKYPFIVSSVGCLADPITAHQAIPWSAKGIKRQRLEWGWVCPAMTHISALLPFQAWVGERDVGPHNCVIATNKKNSDQIIDLYGIDTYVNDKSSISAFGMVSSYFTNFEAPLDIIEKYSDSPSRHKIETLVENYVGQFMMPHMSRDVTEEIVNNILQCDDDFIVSETKRIAHSLKKNSATKAIRAEISKAQEWVADTLIDRRKHIAGFLPDCRAYGVYYAGADLFIDLVGQVRQELAAHGYKARSSKHYSL